LFSARAVSALFHSITFGRSVMHSEFWRCGIRKSSRLVVLSV
jgi:hypothetical protein